MQLVADAFLICSCCSNQEEQRLFSGIAGTFGQNIVELSVWLGMYLIQNQTTHIQTVLGANLSGKHLVETCIGVIDDSLGCCHDLAAFHQSRRHLHHLIRHIKYDGSLLSIGSSTINFCGWLVVCKQEIQSNSSCKL